MSRIFYHREHSVIPSFHDAQLLGFVSQGDVLTLFVEDGQRVGIQIKGVVAFRGTDFRAGNIIREITVRDSETLSLEDIMEVYDLTNPWIEREKLAATAATLLAQAKAEHLKLLELSSSYGGTCVVLGAEVAIGPQFLQLL